MSLNWLNAWVFGICSLCQICRGSCISIRFPRLSSNLAFRVVISAKKRTHLDIFFRRINWLFVARLLKDSSLTKCVLVVITHFPLTCVTVVEFCSVLKEKNMCVYICIYIYVVIWTLSVRYGCCKIRLMMPLGKEKEIFNVVWLLSIHQGD